MTSATYTRLRDLFLELADLPADERTRRLDALASADPAMAARLRTLLGLDDALAESTVQPVADRLSAYRQATVAADVTGLRLGAFVIRREISSGGMGRVFLAERDDGTVEQRAAVKLIRPELFDDAMRRRFHFERQALASLEHRDIAGLIDAGELSDGTPYLVMEFVDGEPVTDYADRHTLDLRARIALVRDVCDAVAYAHRRLIVHRDLKPGNVMVDANGAVKLLDFGIAKPLRAGDVGDKTATANRFWSPYHAAPELWRGEDVGIACDVYGIGMLLYELLCGRLPFDVDRMTPGEIENAVLRVDAPAPGERVRSADVTLAATIAGARKTSPAQLVRQLHGDLDSIVGRCLRKQPQERYSSVEALVQDIDAYLAGRPVAARRGQALYVARKFVARHRIAVGAAAAIAATVVASGAALWNQYRRTELQRDRAQAVTGFLIDTFSAADPAKNLGVPVTAKQLLDQAANRVKIDLGTQPALKAELLLAVADVKQSAGLPRDAAELIALAQETTAGAAVDDGDLRVRLLTSKAQAEMAAQAYDVTQQTIAEALALNPTPRQRLDLEQLAAWGLFSRGKYLDANTKFRALAAEAQNVLAPDDRLQGLIRYRFGVSARTSEESLKIMQALLADQQKYLSPEHPDVLVTTRSIAIYYDRLGRNDEKLRVLKEQDGLIKRLYGEDGVNYASLLTDQGNSLKRLGRTTEAYPLFVRALAIYRKQLGDSHGRIAMALHNLAAASDLDPSLRHLTEGYYQQSIDIAERAFPDGHLNRLLFRTSYSMFLIGQQRHADAQAAIAPALEMADRVPQLKEYDAYPVALACRAIAAYGIDRTESRRVAMEAAVAEARNAAQEVQNAVIADEITALAAKVVPAKGAPNAK